MPSLPVSEVDAVYVVQLNVQMNVLIPSLCSRCSFFAASTAALESGGAGGTLGFMVTKHVQVQRLQRVLQGEKLTPVFDGR